MIRDLIWTQFRNLLLSHNHLAVDVVVGVGAVGERGGELRAGELGRAHRLRPSKHWVAGVGAPRELVLGKNIQDSKTNNDYISQVHF